MAPAKRREGRLANQADARPDGALICSTVIAALVFVAAEMEFVTPATMSLRGRTTLAIVPSPDGSLMS